MSTSLKRQSGLSASASPKDSPPFSAGDMLEECTKALSRAINEMEGCCPRGLPRFPAVFRTKPLLAVVLSHYLRTDPTMRKVVHKIDFEAPLSFTLAQNPGEVPLDFGSVRVDVLLEHNCYVCAVMMETTKATTGKKEWLNGQCVMLARFFPRRAILGVLVTTESNGLSKELRITATSCIEEMLSESRA